MNLGKMFLAWAGCKRELPPRARPTRVRPALEQLETRTLPASISGYVFLDANNNGLFDPGEAPIRGSLVELRTPSGQLVASAVTDAAGFYLFDRDGRVSPDVQIVRHVLTFPEATANQTRRGQVPQFDPSLGTLEAVEIRVQGWFVSHIRVENLDPAPSSVTASVGGLLMLIGPGIESEVVAPEVTEVFWAAAFDGSLDFAGPSGKDFGRRSSFGSGSFLLDDSDGLESYQGRGLVSFSLTTVATSSVSGGNLAAIINSTAGATVEVLYHYRADDSLQPGDYVIVQHTPAGYLDGKDSRNAVVLPNSVGTDSIAVTLADDDLENNNFGEILPASLSGFVYADANNNGLREAGETGIGGVLLTLTGTNDVGQSVTLTTRTATDGSYRFEMLRPGTYGLSQSQPDGYLDGKDAVGSLGGQLGNDRVTNIVVRVGARGVDYNFGELPPASLAGSVYVDADNDGVRGPGETGIAGVSLVLTGTDDLGNAVRITQVTGEDGGYRFDMLRPGTYTLTQTQPAAYLDGKDRVGSLGGTVSADDRVSGIVVRAGSAGRDYDFGELEPASLRGSVYFDRNNNGWRDDGETGIGGVRVTLTGVNDLGQTVNLTARTGADGWFVFAGLRPGSYTLSETQPDGWLDGYDTPGTHDAIVSNDRFANIVLRSGTIATDYHFGELAPSSLSGFVYWDRNANGIRDAEDKGIEGVLITLTGTDDLGNAVTLTTRTDAKGSYRFSNLRPGTYSIAEKQPREYQDGKESLGSLGGFVAEDRFFGIIVGSGEDGRDYNFGELRRPGGGSQGSSDELSKLFLLGSTRRNRRSS